MSLHEWVLEQLAMYAAYHRDGRNRLTHHLGVPLIVFALLLGFNQAPLGTLGAAQITVAQVLLGALMALYLLTIPLIGMMACAFYAAVYAVVLRVPVDVVWPVAIGGFVVGWIIQFVGHAYEGRRPAFLVNLTQVFMAPAFLLAEMLFAVGGGRRLAGELDVCSVKYAARTCHGNGANFAFT